MGWEATLSIFFYGIYTAAIIVSALFVLIPGISLVGILFISQMVNGILLPIILVFVLLTINDKEVMGRYTNGFVFNAVTWITVVALILVSLLLIPVTIIQQLGGG